MWQLQLALEQGLQVTQMNQQMEILEKKWYPLRHLRQNQNQSTAAQRQKRLHRQNQPQSQLHQLLEVKLVKLLKQVQKPPCLILKQHQPVRQHHKQLHTKQRLQKVARP